MIMENGSILEEEDLYFKLGEDIWSSILSLLPLSEAIRTSILSQTWRYAWTFIPDLFIDFDDVTYKRTIKERRLIVNKILTSHSGPIQRCTILTYGSKRIGKSLDGWIKILTEKHIGEFTLLANLTGKYIVPSCLFSCTTIHTLHLTTCYLKALKDMSITCSNLRSLELHDGYVDMEFFHLLLNRCSSLQSLELKRCFIHPRHGDTSILQINAPRLKKLKLTHLRCDFAKTFGWEEIIINAPHLRSLKLGEMMLKDAQLLTPNLQKFNSCMEEDCWIKKQHYKDLKHEGHMMTSILKSIPNLKALKLCQLSSKCLLGGFINIPRFTNMRKLMIELDLREERGVMFLKCMLSNCPCLEELEVKSKMMLLPLGDNEDPWKEKESLGYDYWKKQQEISCFNHTLQAVAIEASNKYDMDFAKFVLATAKVLKQLKISINLWIMHSQEKELEALSSIEKASKEGSFSITCT